MYKDVFWDIVQEIRKLNSYQNYISLLPSIPGMCGYRDLRRYRADAPLTGSKGGGREEKREE